MDNKELKAKIDKVSSRTQSILDATGTQGLVNLCASVNSLSAGEMRMLITSSVTTMTPDQAVDIGWAIYKLGRCAQKLQAEPVHEIPDAEFFAD